MQLAQNLIGTALTNIWMDGVAVIAVLVFLFRIDVWTTLVALSTFPLYLFFFRRFSTEIRTVSRQVQEELSVMSSNAHERISGNVVVRAFTRERTERRRFNAESERLFSTNMRRIRVQSLNQAVTGTLMGLSPLVVIAFGGWRVVRGDISVGDLMAATMYLAPLYLPLQRFSELNIVFANGMAALDRIYEIMDEAGDTQCAKCGGADAGAGARGVRSCEFRVRRRPSGAARRDVCCRAGGEGGAGGGERVGQDDSGESDPAVLRRQCGGDSGGRLGRAAAACAVAAAAREHGAQDRSCSAGRYGEIFCTAIRRRTMRQWRRRRRPMRWSLFRAAQRIRYGGW